jgi:hypothetical protein
MSCDHKWFGGGEEYSKTRTESWPKLGTIEICDMCKAVLKNGKKIGYQEYCHMTERTIIIGVEEVLDVYPIRSQAVQERLDQELKCNQQD